MPMDIRNLVISIISEKCYIEKNEVRDDMTIEGDLFVDSLGFTAIIVELEKTLAMHLPAQELQLSIKGTVGELYRRLEEYYKNMIL